MMNSSSVTKSEMESFVAHRHRQNVTLLPDSVIPRAHASYPVKTEPALCARVRGRASTTRQTMYRIAAAARKQRRRSVSTGRGVVIQTRQSDTNRRPAIDAACSSFFPDFSRDHVDFRGDALFFMVHIWRASFLAAKSRLAVFLPQVRVFSLSILRYSILMLHDSVLY